MCTNVQVLSDKENFAEHQETKEIGSLALVFQCYDTTEE